MVLDFEQDNVYVKFTPEEYVDTKTYCVNVYAKNKSDGGSEKLVYTSPSYTFKSCEENSWHIVIDYMFYNAVAKKVAISGKPLPNIIDFSFKILIGEEEEVPGVYSIHFVRYMPKLLNILDWSNGEKLQRIWFTNKSNTDKEKVDPKIDIITWDWAIQESQEVKDEFNEFYKDIINNLEAFLNNKSRNTLKSEINKMITEGKTYLPTASKPKTSFDPLSKDIITYENSRFPSGEKIPTYEKYYFDHKPFSGIWDLGKHFLRDGFDDFVAALANFNFHVVAKGELIYEAGNIITSPYTKVKVKQLAFYIKDNWDFIDKPNEEQPLGFWKIESKNQVIVDDDPNNADEYFEVTNRDYRNYRDEHKKGYNYHLYSTLHIEDVDIEFKL